MNISVILDHTKVFKGQRCDIEMDIRKTKNYVIQAFLRKRFLLPLFENIMHILRYNWISFITGDISSKTITWPISNTEYQKSAKC